MNVIALIVCIAEIHCHKAKGLVFVNKLMPHHTLVQMTFF